VNSRLYLFGHPHIEVDGVPVTVKRRKVLGLIAYLALNGQIHSREALATLFWPDLDQTRALAAFRRLLIDLKGMIPAEALNVNRQSIALLPSDKLWIDVKTFDEYLDLSREQATADMLESLIKAVQLYKLDFMAGFSLTASAEFDNWQITEQESLRLKFANVLRQLVEVYTAQSDYKQAITYAIRNLALDSLDETRHRTLMRLYAQDGQISAAMRQYQECTRLLETELDVEPMPETTALFEQIRNNTMATVQRDNTITSILPPLPTLLIGRDKVRDDLYNKLQSQHPIVSIQGWPGVGKSTMVALLAHDPAIRMLYPDGALWVSLGESL
jgi:DNA-binding SARP family transcriptional activator